MRNSIATVLFIYSSFLYAADDFCKESTNGKFEKYPGFNINFCFSSPEFMKNFASHLYDEKISFVVYENGYIGYRAEDKARVEKIGNSLISEYYKAKRKE